VINIEVEADDDFIVINTNGIKCDGEIRLGADNGGATGGSYFTITNSMSTDTAGPAVTYLTNAPTGGTTATAKWLKCYSPTSNRVFWIQGFEIT
jgi:hypothetical protein